MTTDFIGGALGSLISAAAYQHAGWYGVASTGLVLCILNITTWRPVNDLIRQQINWPNELD
ncbi:hypothetical protein ymoll0001_12240 [Yersinia mollaretii ATCC 43969]|uniref:MFS transporter n=1 Tax=Yersinia mollaretii (strain ATCC 43969 / DSM 18520 / CIP 103324 / CNY 7263 / WAIP 204) TaxID=349967 RepID=A0ABM9YF20_YERMW|nr:hypothetical protein ymoll0001_12240 [Yersinia mollaretii ATCC 43969]CNF67711.1 sugar transporter [Yersinia mollaretii]